MIKVSVLYPYKEGVGFDMTYYLNSHIPMVRQKLGAACKGAAVEQGVAGGAPATRPAYVAMGHLLFRYRGVVSGGICAACGNDHGRHPELHSHSAGHPNQRSEAAVKPALLVTARAEAASFRVRRRPACIRFASTAQSRSPKSRMSATTAITPTLRPSRRSPKARRSRWRRAILSTARSSRG